MNQLVPGELVEQVRTPFENLMADVADALGWKVALIVLWLDEKELTGIFNSPRHRLNHSKVGCPVLEILYRFLTILLLLPLLNNPS